MASSPSAEDTADAQSNVRLMYASYFFAAWGDRMWEFAAIVFLLEIFPQTLLPPSLFGFFEAAAGIAFGSHIGSFIDRTNRLNAIRVSIAGQNAVICCASVLFAFALFNTESWPRGAKVATLVVIILAGMAAKVASSMNKISIHKDWVVVLAGGNDAFQTLINSGMRRVDLSCSILAPLLVGVLSAVVKPAWTCVFIALWSVASLAVEFFLSRKVYDQVKGLHVKPINTIAPEEEGQQKERPNWFVEQWTILSKYFRHRAFGVSFPYCLLYISALSFGGTMVSFLRALGVADVWLAAGRGAAALVAIGSTFAIPPMVRRLGLVVTGVVTSWIQIGCLTPLLIAFLVTPSFEDEKQLGFIILVFVTVCLSRFGLWGFDLAQTQLMQQLVEHEQAGAINGAQEMLINVCYLLSYSLTVIFSDPADFRAPVLLSYEAILAAGVIFYFYAAVISKMYQEQEHNEQQEVTRVVSAASPNQDTIPLAQE